MGSITEPPSDAPQMMYPAPLEAGRDAGLSKPATNGASGAHYDITTAVLVVGGGPVGMLQALMLARIHKVPSVLIEREASTTTFPKMEYTNGRSMEIYRAMGLADELRKVGNGFIKDDATCNELVVTSMIDGQSGAGKETWDSEEGGRGEAKLIETWERENPNDFRRMSKETNDGTQYLEPHVRCHQIPVEAWLRTVVERESKLIESHWGWQYIGLEEIPGQDGEESYVVSEVRNKEGEMLRIKSNYVIGCDGGGSWVRKSIGLESKRRFLDLTTAFVHFRSKSLRAQMPFPHFWHANIVGGGLLVSQNEDDLWTCHLMLPPGVDGSQLTSEDIVSAGLGGSRGPTPCQFDEVYCRGIWKAEVAIADAFQSTKTGRVFLAGDAAHQLSPVGGHGLNSGLADAYDLAWKLAAHIKGWGSDALLQTYDLERRQIAHKNLDTVENAVAVVAMPLFVEPGIKYGAPMIVSDTPEGKEARAAITQVAKDGHWLHNQHGNMLGYQYTDSNTVVKEQETTKRPISDRESYLPTTWPGSRAPHVWLQDGKRSTLDAFRKEGMTLVDFTANGAASAAFETAAKQLDVPFQSVNWSGEENMRKVYERDVVLVRPDGHVAWRICEGHSEIGLKEAKRILSRAVGR